MHGRRVFLAIPLPKPLRDPCLKVLDQLRGIGGVKWVRPDHLHMTLHFFASVTDGELKSIVQVARQVSGSWDPFQMGLRGFSAFPDLSHPRVYWLGLSGDIQKCGTIQHQIGEQLTAAGIGIDNRLFQAHLTLGRVKSREEGRIEKISQDLSSFATERVLIDHFALYESHLQVQGPQYEILETFRF